MFHKCFTYVRPNNDRATIVRILVKGNEGTCVTLCTCRSKRDSPREGKCLANSSFKPATLWWPWLSTKSHTEKTPIGVEQSHECNPCKLLKARVPPCGGGGGGGGGGVPGTKAAFCMALRRTKRRTRSWLDFVEVREHAFCWIYTDPYDYSESDQRLCERIGEWDLFHNREHYIISYPFPRTILGTIVKNFLYLFRDNRERKT